VLISSAFGAFLDKRELQNADQLTPGPRQINPTTGLWIDFIADTGDGFDPTYTVAWLASQPELKLSNHERSLPRGSVVILGGDEVYPVAAPDAYQTRFWGPYEASLPWCGGEAPALYAIPGNHDWYDGLTNFFRFFCQDRWLGGRKTTQKRSYFAVELAHNWWILGIDIQLDSYIDEPQKDFFEAVPLQAGDKVILCTAAPSWYDGPGHQGYQNLVYIEEKIIAAKKARVVLSLSGDSHHYAHYSRDADGARKLTAGGGGAFLHDTHSLKDTLPPDDLPGNQRFSHKACYPHRQSSRVQALGAVTLPIRNPTFMIVPAVLYLIIGWSSQVAVQAFGQVQPGDDKIQVAGWQDIGEALFRNPVSVLVVAVLALGVVGFAKAPDWVHGPFAKLTKLPMGAVHLSLHLIAIVVVGIVAAHLASLWWGGGWPFTLRLLLLMTVLGGIVGGFVVGLYLALTSALLGAHGNEAFSAMRSEGYKNFLRLHLDADGALTVYPIGIQKANKRWRLDPTNTRADASWIAPDGPEPVAHLIEEPFQIS